VRQPSYLEHLSTVLDEVPIEDWREWLRPGAARRGAVPLDDFVETNFDFYGRTLNGTPSCGPAGSAASRWSRARSARRSAASTSPGTSRRVQGDDGRAGRQPARGLPRSITDLDWMGEETKQRAFEKLDTFRPKIGYPDKFRDYSALEFVPPTT
jgi:putative endopeptidase